jgi:hypothetical protein
MADTTQQTPGMLGDWYKSYMASTPSSTGYTANTATTTEWAPDSKSTVQGQLTGILDAGSPLMTRAETAAKQGMNQRGLLNSSMAVTAGQAALYDAALPIAKQDANTFAEAGKTNATAKNTTSQFNAQFGNEASKFGAQSANDALERQRAAGVQSAQIDQQAQAQAAQLAQQQTFQGSQNQLDRQQQSTLQEDQRKFQAGESALLRQLQADLQTGAQEAQVKQLAQQHANTLEQLGYQSKLATAQVPAGFAAGISSTTMNQVGTILADPNLDAAAKKNAIDNVVNYANSTMSWAEKFYGTTLPKIMVPGAETAAPGVATPAPAPAPAPAAEQNAGRPGMNYGFNENAWDNPGGF